MGRPQKKQVKLNTESFLGITQESYSTNKIGLWW